MDTEMLFGMALIIAVGLISIWQAKKNNDEHGPNS